MFGVIDMDLGHFVDVDNSDNLEEPLQDKPTPDPIIFQPKGFFGSLRGRVFSSSKPIHENDGINLVSAPCTSVGSEIEEIIDSSETADTVPVTPPQEKYIKFIELPPEIIKIVIFHVYKRRHSIIPIITCCKYLYEKFAFLIYMSKVVHINDDKRTIGSDASDRSTDTLNFIMKHEHDVATYITVFTMTSKVNFKFNPAKIPLNTNLFMKVAPMMNSLVVLTIEGDDPNALFKSLCHLPKSVQVLRIYIKLTYRQMVKIEHPLLTEDELKNLSVLQNLRYLEFESKKVALQHPPHDFTRYDTDTSNRSSSVFNGIAKSIKLFKSSDSIVTKVVKQIGEICYHFTLRNRHNIIKLEILGIDVNLIMSRQEHRFPFSMPKLRVLFFDNTSKLNFFDWISMFQEMNRIQTFENTFPLMMYYEKLSQRIYYNDTRYERSAGVNTEENSINPERWRFSEQVASAYAILNRKRDVTY